MAANFAKFVFKNWLDILSTYDGSNLKIANWKKGTFRLSLPRAPQYGIEKTCIKSGFYLGFRPFARWRHFTTTTRILFVFLFIFKCGSPSEV